MSPFLSDPTSPSDRPPIASDAEADALLFRIDIEHLDLDGLALLIVLDRLVALLVPGQVREMHHAVDVAGQADEQTEFGDVADLALQHGARRMVLGECLPGILDALLQTEADAALVGIDFQHHHVDVLAEKDFKLPKYASWPGYENGLQFVARRYCGLWGRGT